MTLHDAILEIAGLSDEERQQAVLTVNPMTWLLCGADCSPANMSINTALERATRNLNTHTAATLTEGSPLWVEAIQAAAKANKAVAVQKRRVRLASKLTVAERNILEHANFADRILYSIAAGHELQLLQCINGGSAPARRIRMM